ncbi:hypothetical protein GC089_09165 [Cellulomonas sp. JZ18]|uniref:hypothetical protein n=1 Tax=Cellulomonas sp. JZ18 TaxID=2654191 RepID=UPI0012D3BE35|nr:hypothetical protein [Cellulomonas sp. JZ18]QGQ19370.1 hypothetical protein GC089_09165 [Cellulomonas sp. JZ18]
MNTKSTPWVGGTIVLSVLVAALAWFLAISPTLASAATARTETAAAEDRNAQLQAQLDRLVQQAAQLDATKADLAAIGRQIPGDAQMAEYTRTLQAAAEATGVTIVGLDASTPEGIAPAAPAEAPVAEAAPAEAPAEGTEGGEAPADGAADPAAAPAPAGPAPVEGMAGVQLKITVVGPVPNALAFVEQLQTGTERLFLVTQYSGKGLQAAAPENGRPAINQGDVELLLTGYVYALAPLDGATPAEPTEETPLAPLPAGTDPRVVAEAGAATTS